MAVRWQGVLMVLNEPIPRPDGSFHTYQTVHSPDLPITLGADHFDSEAVASIEEITVEGDLVRASGAFSETDEGMKAAMQVSEGVLRTVSVELRNGTRTESSMVDDDGDEIPLIVWDPVTIGAAALERLPAFEDAVIEIDPSGDQPPESMVELARTAGPGPHVYPAAHLTDPDDGFTYEGAERFEISDDGEITGYPLVFGREYTGALNWQAKPYGLAADGQQIVAKYGMRGATRLDDGRTVETMNITMAHADQQPSGLSGDELTRWVQEQPAAQLGVVRVWEDEHGIAVHGSTHPDVSPEMVARAMAGCFSVDERREPAEGFRWVFAGVGCVNRCGFDPPPLRTTVEGGRELARVASVGVNDEGGCACKHDGDETPVEEPAPVEATDESPVEEPAVEVTAAEEEPAEPVAEIVDVGALADVDRKMRDARFDRALKG